MGSLVQLLTTDLKENAISIVRQDEFDLVFNITRPFAGFSSGRLSINEFEMPELSVMVDQDLEHIRWDGESVISSIQRNPLFSRKVSYHHSASQFCNSNLAFISRMSRCPCESGETTDRRLLGFDLSFPEVPRSHGVITTGRCLNALCGLWRLQTFQIEVTKISQRSHLITLILQVCADSQIHVPDLNCVLDAPNHQFKHYAVGPSKRSIQNKKNQIAQLKGLSLDDAKKRTRH